MTKSELLSTYTAEQLAEMAEKLDIASEMSAKQIYNLQFKINDLEEENGRLQAIVDTYNKFLLPRCTKEAREMIDHNRFGEVMIVTCEQWREKGEESKGEAVYLPKEYAEVIREFLNIDTSEIKDDCHRFGVEGLQRYLKIDSPKKQSEIEHLKSKVEKYRKAIEDTKKERDFQICKYQKKIDVLEHDLKTAGEKIQDLAGENMKLQCERNDYKSKIELIEAEKMEEKQISDFPSTEPIRVADMLISAEGEYERHPIAKAICGTDKGTYQVFDVADLRQIAEHLLVYCNHNEEAEG